MRSKRVIAAALLFTLLISCAPAPASPSVPASPSETPPAAPSPLAPPPSVSPAEEPSPSPSPSPSPVPLDLVEYSGQKYHIFYHFLIAYPEIAYNDGYGKNLDTDCVTPTEFRRSLEELHKNNFVLVDLNDCYKKNADGTVSEVPLMLPEGKKPLVMSFDDINYPPDKSGRGICDKVIIDPATGRLAMLTVKDGAENVTYDNDVIPMLETFCAEFPDFAPFGVKGMICLTGFEGILGYRTQRDSPNRESEVEAVKPVVRQLKDNGWYFASHGYGHRHEGQVTLDVLKKDAEDWENEVEPLTGETKIHVFPYGDYVKTGLWDGKFSDGNMRYLIDDMGFEVLCGVGMYPFFKTVGNCLFTDRANIDGTSLRAQNKAYGDLMDPNVVYCPEERNNIPIKAPALAGAVDDNGLPVYHGSVIDVMIGGDVSLYGILGDVLRDGGTDAVIDGGVSALFQEADISLFNLESAVTDIGEPWPGKDYALRASPEIIPFLQDTLSADAVSLANNHSIDYGTEAFFDTLDRLAAAGIGVAGGGENLAAAMQPAVFEVKGQTVAFLAACQHAPNMEWYAKEDRPGLLMCYDPALITQAIREAKDRYDYVITYIHWGDEYVLSPDNVQVNTAHKLIDAGADAVIGAHPHVIQSFEVYKGKPIAYSLGNFLMRNRNDNTALALLRIYGGEVRMEIIPCHVEGRNRVSLSSPEQRNRLLDEWRSRSPNAVITDGGVLREAG